MAQPHPTNTPLDQWPNGWLVFETASLLDDPMFITRHSYERTARKEPATREEMIAFIRAKYGMTEPMLRSQQGS